MDKLEAVLSSPVFHAFFIVCAVLGGTVWAYIALKTKYIGRLQYSREFSSDGAFARERFELIETVTNDTLVPLFFVRYEFFVPEGLTVDGEYCASYAKRTSRFHLLPRSTVRKVHTVYSDKRGLYTLQNANVTYRKVYYELESETHIYVYPDCAGLYYDMGTDIYRAGDMISRRRIPEDPFCFAGIRQYRAGDPIRSINFKASAHAFVNGMRALMSNEYESSRNYDTMIFMDAASYSEAELSPEESKEVFEGSLNASTYLFCETVKNGGRIGFAANCPTKDSNYTFVPCGSGMLHNKEILERFAEISYYSQRNYSFEALIKNGLPQSPRGVDFYFITTYVNSSLAETLSRFRSLGYSIYVIDMARGKRRAERGNNEDSKAS